MSVLVLCEYSKFRIESNSYLIFDSIRNWRNYSKFLNTYLTVISRATEKWFVCTLPATGHCTCLSLNPVLCRVCSYPSHSPDHARRAWAAAPVRACSQHQTVISDSVITAGGKHSTRSVERWTFCQYCYGFKFNFNTETDKAFEVCDGDTGPANVILSLFLAHATCCLVSAAHVRKTTSVQLQPRIAIVADWQAQ